MTDIEREKLKRLYGLLWKARVDRGCVTGFVTSEARKLALSMLTKHEQAEGIEWANRYTEKEFFDGDTRLRDRTMQIRARAALGEEETG